MSLKIEFDLHTSFHLGLAGDGWRKLLKEWFELEIKLHQGVVQVSSDYNEERFMGEQSIVKYRFQGKFSSESQPLGDSAEFEFEYKPKLRTFKLRSLAWGLKFSRLAVNLPKGTTGLHSLPCSTLAMRLVLSRAESMDSKLIIFDAQDSFVVVGSDLKGLMKVNSFRLERRIVPSLVNPEEFDRLWFQCYGVKYELERLRLSFTPKSDGKFEGTVQLALLDTTEPPFALQDGDGVIQLHIMDWLGRKSSNDESSLIKVETLVRVICKGLVCWVESSQQKHYEVEEGTVGRQSKCTYSTREISSNDWDRIWQQAVTRPWLDYTIQQSKLLEQWWTLRSWGEGCQKTCTQRCPGEAAYVERFLLLRNPPWAEQCLPFVKFCISVLELAFTVSIKQELLIA